MASRKPTARANSNPGDSSAGGLNASIISRRRPRPRATLLTGGDEGAADATTLTVGVHVEVGRRGVQVVVHRVVDAGRTPHLVVLERAEQHHLDVLATVGVGEPRRLPRDVEVVRP